jgi:hypothetical protein
MATVSVAVPRKGRPLEAVLERVATLTDETTTADRIISTLQYEKAITKGHQSADHDVYDRLARYSDLSTPSAPEYTLLRDDRANRPRRIVFDSVTVSLDGVDLQLIGREEPFRALRTHEFALGFDSADLVLEEIVQLRDAPLADIASLNDRIDPMDTDVRVRGGLGDTVYHTLLGTPATIDAHEPDLTRSLVDTYEGNICISPRYERLVEAVLGTDAIEGVTFQYPDHGQTEEAAIAAAGLGVYLTVTGSTARDHGLVVGEQLFPSETVLLENTTELDATAAEVATRLASVGQQTELTVSP